MQQVQQQKRYYEADFTDKLKSLAFELEKLGLESASVDPPPFKPGLDLADLRYIGSYVMQRLNAELPAPIPASRKGKTEVQATGSGQQLKLLKLPRAGARSQIRHDNTQPD